MSEVESLDAYDLDDEGFTEGDVITGKVISTFNFGGIENIQPKEESPQEKLVQKKAKEQPQREEEIYIQARSRPIRLPRNNPALRLLQQVRDEAHRFAQHYHHILRRKKTFEEDVTAGRRPPPGRKKQNRSNSRKKDP